MGELVAELAARMGIDPALAPIDILETRFRKADGSWGSKLSLYVNSRGASELAKRHELTDLSLEVDIRDRVVIVQCAKATPSDRIVRDVGASAFDPEKPDTLAMAVKKATTSAHRRVTLRAVGIFLDEPPEAAKLDA